MHLHVHMANRQRDQAQGVRHKHGLVSRVGTNHVLALPGAALQGVALKQEAARAKAHQKGLHEARHAANPTGVAPNSLCASLLENFVANN